MLRVAERAAKLATRYHRAKLIGAHHLPTGPALLVGNHGLYGYETPVFFYLLLQATGRYPLGLADRGFFRLPVFKTVMPMIGGIEGTPDNALRALNGGGLVVCYPGGAREVFKRPTARYQLRWEHTSGFVRVAMAAGVPIIPFAGHGIDDIFAVSEGLTVRLSRKKRRYTAPVGMPVPLPVRLKFAIGRPMYPPALDAPGHEQLRFRDRVAATVQRLLVRASDA